MGEWDIYIDAVCETDQYGTMPPLDENPEYDADAETWDLYFGYTDSYTGGNDMVCLPFENKQDAIATQERILSDRQKAQTEHEQQKAKKVLDKNPQS
jgi:hypothetical protein